MQTPVKLGKVAAQRRRPLHSIHMLQSGMDFVGNVARPGGSSVCRFHPVQTGIAGGKFEFTGTFSVLGPGRQARTTGSVKATLASIQSAYGARLSPPPYYAARISGAAEAADPPPLPITENTDTLGYAGVLYLHLSPMDGVALGLPYDLKKVQLNVRLAPQSTVEREMQWLFSAVSGALLSSSANESVALEYVEDINRRLKG